MDWWTILTLLVALATLIVIMVRPKGINEAMAALGGAALMLVLGRVKLDEAATVLFDQWDVFLFFLGLMTIAALAERAGFFEWTAAMALKLSGGSGLRLFLNVFLLGTLITAFLSNDATALILTPVVYTLVTRLGANPLPFMFACTFIADTASFLLPVSNPINILMGGTFPEMQSLQNFWLHLLVAAVLVIGINIGLFILIFRRQLPTRFEIPPTEASVKTNQSFFKYASFGLALIAVSYVIASLTGIPLSFVALGGAAFLLAGAMFYRQLEWRQLGREISWSIFGFIGGMFIVVRGVENIGFTGEIGHWLVSVVGTSSFLAVFVGMFFTALGTNFINNVPMTIVMLSALQQAGINTLTPAVHSGLIYATLVGADVGPNLTTVGSLATVLWLLILRRKGLEVSSRQYFKLGMLVTPLMLVAASLALWLSLQFF